MVLGPAFANALLESGHAVRPTTKQNDSWLLGTRRKKKKRTKEYREMWAARRLKFEKLKVKYVLRKGQELWIRVREQLKCLGISKCQTHGHEVETKNTRRLTLKYVCEKWRTKDCHDKKRGRTKRVNGMKK